MATLADIARLLNVNKTTVSKALRGSSDISRETREKVLRAAGEMGYRPRARAEGNAGGMIGLICPEIVSHHYSRLVTSIDARLRQKGFLPHILLTGFSPALEENALRALAGLRVAGVVCITEQPDIGASVAGAFGLSGVPVVILGLNYESPEHDVLSVDEMSGIAGAVDQLLRGGHRRIAFIGEPLTDGRLNCFRTALRERGAACPEALMMFRNERGESCGYNGMRALLALPEGERPTAVVAAYDTIALGAFRAIAERGLRVPEDISLTGFDDADFCPYLPVSLSSVSCNVEEMGRVAVAILLRKVRDRGFRLRQAVKIHAKFLPRESVAPVRGGGQGPGR